MKISKVQVDNVLGLASAVLPLSTPIALIAGPNGAGKSSLRQSISLALLGELPRVKLKKELPLLVRDGAKKGSAAVTTTAGEFRFELPAGKGAHLEDAAALPFLLEPATFARISDDDRRRFLFGLAGVQVSTDEVRRRLAAGGCDVQRAEAVLPLLRAGFPEAHKDAARRATEAKGAWRGVTGETYGEKKAEGWQAPVPDHDAIALVAARADLSKADEALQEANRRLGGLEQQLQQEDKLEQRREFLRRHADEVSERAEKVQLAQKAVDDYRPKVEAAREARKGGHPLTCPHCSGEVMLDAHQGALVPYQEPKAPEPGAFTLNELEEGLGVLERTLANRQRDLQQAQDAIRELDALAAQEPVDGEALEAARGEATRLRQERDELQERLHELEAAARAAKEAEAVTEKAAEHHAEVQAWARIAAALAPDGIPGELLAEALEPVNDRLRDSAQATGWRQVLITPDMQVTAEARPYQLLSESEQWRCDAMLAEAIAHLSGLRLVLLDRFDVLDLAGRGEALGWLLELAEAGEIDSALVFGTLKTPPANLPEPIGCFWLEGGTVANRTEGKAA